MKIEKLWTIVLDDGLFRGEPMTPSDCNPDGNDDGMIVYRDEASAVASAKYQTEELDVPCVACRLDKLFAQEAKP